MTDDEKAPDGIPVVQPSFAKRDWEEIQRLREDLAETKGMLDEARERIQIHRKAVAGVTALHVQMRSGTAGETAAETILVLLDELVAASGPLDRNLGIDRGLRTAYVELGAEHRRTSMMLVAERAAGNARIDFLSRECQRIAAAIPSLNDVIRHEQTEGSRLRTELEVYRAAHDALVTTIGER